MLNVYVENIGDMAVIACEGRIVQSEAAFRLRNAVMSQRYMRTIVLDLTEAHAVEGGGLGMLASLLKWGKDHDIAIKLYNPTHAVKSRLESYDLAHFEFATFKEMMALLLRAEGEPRKIEAPRADAA
jgi:anti-anti-sigma regulatory factor